MRKRFALHWRQDLYRVLWSIINLSNVVEKCKLYYMLFLFKQPLFNTENKTFLFCTLKFRKLPFTISQANVIWPSEGSVSSKVVFSCEEPLSSFQIAHFYLIASSWTTAVKLVTISMNIPEVNHNSEKSKQTYNWKQTCFLPCFFFHSQKMEALWHKHIPLVSSGAQSLTVI